jgi:homoaconitase/3-isopropylmalate dehydratase large subunit
MKLDGVFIGACTTAEEDLILAALVLQEGLKLGMVPVINGTRKVTPGSVSITAKLRRLGLLEVYEKAGFEVGAPGCSYCLGIAADKAGEVIISYRIPTFIVF